MVIKTMSCMPYLLFLLDLPIGEVLKLLSEGFLKEVKPYRFARCDWSKKYGWLVEIYKVMPEKNIPEEYKPFLFEY